MKKTISYLGLLFALLSIGCQSHTVQTTSGREYLSSYAPTNQTEAKIDGEEELFPSTDREVREVANIEPSLHFPARIGLAKLYNGKITNLTAEEVQGWNQAKEELGSEFGEFVPVSSMIAELVYADRPKVKDNLNRTSEIFRKIRLGSARQHLHYVIIYEVFSKTKTTKLASSVANWTIVGGYFIPSREIETTGYANALLLDVRTAYPYGTASSSLNANEISAWFNDRDKARNLADKNQVSTVIKLIPEVQEMIKKLMQELKEA